MRIAAIVPSWGIDPHLGDVVAALLDQTMPVERIVVYHTGPSDPRERLAEHPKLSIHHQDKRLYPGGARNAGAALARDADWFAFVDSDVIVPSDWVEEMLDHAGPRRAVCSAILPDNDSGYGAHCLWWLEFGSIHPYLPPRVNDGGASAALMFPAPLFWEIGGFNDKMLASEDSELFARLAQRGDELLFASGPAIRHRFWPGMAPALRRSYTLGTHSARHRKAHSHLPGASAVRYPILSLGLWLARTALMAKRTLRSPGAPRAAFLWHFPGILACAVAWNAGFSVEAFKRG